jgi:hypothetical protein
MVFFDWFGKQFLKKSFLCQILDPYRETCENVVVVSDFDVLEI